MNTQKRLTQVFKSSPSIPIDNQSKFVIMSDCHRGDGSSADTFLKNQNLFFAALTHYYENGFSYIELGDGDELWENRKLEQIINIHSDAFWLMTKFYDENRLYLIYGNHDMVKKYNRFVRQKCANYYCEVKNDYLPLFPDITITEGLILENTDFQYKIFLAHGHQGDLLNDTLWKLARFLVRYLWKPLELIGILDPTNAGKNYKKRGSVERRLIHWVTNEKQMLIAGHTHRPVFPNPKKPPYFNDGSCVHPRCITAIEIENGTIALVKWTIQTDEKLSLFVGRTILDGPRAISDYFYPTSKIQAPTENQEKAWEVTNIL